MAFNGKFKYQKNENYEEFLRFMDMGWLQRKKSLLCTSPLVITEDIAGTLMIKSDEGGKRKVVLGEEHAQRMPNGELVKAVTVREGDNCLITRIKAPWNLELREEFTEAGMIQVVRHVESDLEAVRYFKRC